MLKVDQYSYIRTAHRVYGKNIKQIARVNMLSILVLRKHGDRRMIFIPTSWKPSQVTALNPGILVVRNDETGK
jgi:hypothetical protein